MLTDILRVFVSEYFRKVFIRREKKKKTIKIMFGNNFCFLFSKTCFWEFKEKIIFLYFLNKKHVWLVEI